MMRTLSIFTHLTHSSVAQAQFQGGDNNVALASEPLQQVQFVQELPPQLAQLYPGGIYDASRLAQLNGEIPPYDPSYPASDQGYLVPVWVDDIEDIPDAASYNWLDPSTDASIWASYGVTPEKIGELTNAEVSGGSN